jgi:hypothetical protein
MSEHLEIKELLALEKGKVYVLECDADYMYKNSDTITKIITSIQEGYGIDIIVLDKSFKFITLPKGYEIIKKEK